MTSDNPFIDAIADGNAEYEYDVKIVLPLATIYEDAEEIEAAVDAFRDFGTFEIVGCKPVAKPTPMPESGAVPQAVPHRRLTWRAHPTKPGARRTVHGYQIPANAIMERYLDLIPVSLCNFKPTQRVLPQVLAPSRENRCKNCLRIAKARGFELP